MKIINCSIDVKKIDKAKIKHHKNGAAYYDLTIYVNDEPNQWGQDVSIATCLTKEEREANVKQTYIGNGKVVVDRPPQAKPAEPEQRNEDFNDLPF